MEMLMTKWPNVYSWEYLLEYSHLTEIGEVEFIPGDRNTSSDVKLVEEKLLSVVDKLETEVVSRSAGKMQVYLSKYNPQLYDKLKPVMWCSWGLPVVNIYLLSVAFLAVMRIDLFKMQYFVNNYFCVIRSFFSN